jgi:hypothetical protein
MLEGNIALVKQNFGGFMFLFDLGCFLLELLLLGTLHTT